MTTPKKKILQTPPRIFTWTLDQIAMMLNISVDTIKGYLHYQGRSVGTRSQDEMVAKNIAPPGKDPEWRVEHKEFVRYCRRRGLSVRTDTWT